MIGNTDYPGYNVNQRSLLVNGRTQMNGNLTINGNISVNSTNIALGLTAAAGTVGTNTVAIGSQAGQNNLGSESIAIGYNTSVTRLGLYSTAVGSYSGYNQTGSYNTFIGREAGYDSTAQRTGGYNTYVGWGTSASSSAHEYSTAIGTGAQITGNRQIVLGTTNETVSIPGSINCNSVNTQSNTVYCNRVRLTEGANAPRNFNMYGGATLMYNDSGIGVYLLNGSTGWVGNSDIILKKNITEISNSLQGILNIKPVTYNFKTDEESERLRIGFIAQNVQEYFPLVINETIDEKYERPILGITYTELIPYMVKAIQEQQIMISNLEARLSALENK